MNSILNSIKKMLGIEIDDDSFDTDIIFNINAAIMILTQLGIGNDSGFFISDESAVWSDLIGDSKRIEAAKMYVYLKVRLSFDPPTSSAVLESINRQLDELAWRLSIQADTGGE